MRTANEIKKEVLEKADGDIQRAIYALEDGEYLESVGIEDCDQCAVEDAHTELTAELKASKN